MGGKKSGGTKRNSAKKTSPKAKRGSVAWESPRKRQELGKLSQKAGSCAVLRETDAGVRYAGAREASALTRDTAASASRRDVRPRASLAEQLESVASREASGQMRRKNMNVDQGLLHAVIAASGATSETEAVRLGLAAYVEMAAFERSMLTGFDRWSPLSGFTIANDAPIDVAAFIARSRKAKKASAR